MKEQLSERSTEELREMFPIILKEHTSQYKEWYEIEKKNILNAIKAEDIVRINHIGSSSVEGLIAKPIIDILLEIDGNCNVAQLTSDLQSNAWGLMRFNRENEPMRLMFGKGYSPDGFAEKVYHLHVSYIGNHKELYFRDYLMAHPDVAVEYGKLKLGVLKDYKHNISIFEDEFYTNVKADFITKYTDIAKQEFHGRYKPR